MSTSSTSPISPQPCHKQACAIQSCLTKNNYQESRCKDVIEKLEQCCQALIDAGGSSPSCPIKKYTRKTSAPASSPSMSSSEPTQKDQHQQHDEKR